MRMNFKKRLWISVGIIALSIVFAGGAIFYFSGDLQANATKLINARASAQATAADLQHLADLEHDQPLAAQYQTAMSSLIPTKTDLINIPPDIEKLAATDNVTASFSFQQNPSAPASGSVGSIPFSLQVQGSFDNITSFVKDVETNSGFLLTINTFDFSNSGDDNARLTAQGTFYFQ